MFLWRFIQIQAKCTETGVRDAEAAPAVAEEAPAVAVPWADLHGDLLESIATAAGLSLRDYTAIRGVCTAWRSSLARPSYAGLLSLAKDQGRHNASVFCLLTRRWFHLHTLSSNFDDHARLRGVFDFLPPTRRRLVQPRPILSKLDYHGQGLRARVVGSGNGRFALAVDEKHSATDAWRWIFLVDPRTGKQVELVTPPRVDEDGCVRKIVFAPNPNHDWAVVALCHRGNVAYIDGKVDRKWTTNDVDRYLVDLAFSDTAQDLYCYCLDSRGGVHALRTPCGRRNGRLTVAWRRDFRPAAFARPYDVVYQLTSTKHIFFCNGSLYQAWQNNSCNVSSETGYFRMSAGEIFVLRYDHGRSPCWTGVRDLGGCSVFVGKKSSPAVVRAGAVPGIRADCVYWIDLKDVPMVCDIATGSSKPCVLPYGACEGNCWYFGHDNMAS